MGFIGDMFSSQKGAGYQAAGAGYGTAGNAPMTAKTENWVGNDTMNGQQGIINQSMGRSQGGLDQQQSFANAAGAGGQQGMAAQQGLMSQLGQQAQGKGPNPAQAMLAQNTGQNVQNQSAMMGSQRGASQNVGMIGRQAAQQGANTQQQSVGQAATLGAQQQLAAQSQLGQLSGQAVGQQSGALQNYNQMAQNYQGLGQQQQQAFLNAQAQANNANVNMQSNINSANSAIANTNTKGQQGILGGVMSGVGSLLGLAHGGEVPGYDVGGSVDSSSFNLGVNTDLGSGGGSGPQSFAGKFLSGESQPSNQGPAMGGSAQGASSGGGDDSGASALQKGAKDLFGGKAAEAMKGGGGGEGGGGMTSMLPMLMAANKGGPVKKFSPGGKVGGQAQVKGDSLKNDTVAAKLSPGEIVIPRSVLHGSDPVNASAKFVQAIMAKENMRKRV